MSRIPLITADVASSEQLALLTATQRQLGTVPDLWRVFAQSPAALTAFIGLHHVAREGLLDLKTRERIALALAQRNGCHYCLSAHTALGSAAGLNGAEMESNRAGDSHDARAAVAVRFACRLVEARGDVDDSDLLAMRRAGFSDGEIVEVITHAGLNVLTNLLGRASQLASDFPPVALALVH